MKFSVNCGEFYSVLLQVSKSCSLNPNETRIGLKNIKMVVQDRVILTGTSNHTSTIRSISAQIEMPGMASLSVVESLELVKTLKKEKSLTIELITDGPISRVRISQGRSKFYFSQVPLDIIPNVDWVPVSKHTPLDTLEFLKAIDKVSHCMETDDLRPAMNGVYFEPSEEPGFTRAVATDGRILSCFKFVGVITKPFILKKECVFSFKDTLANVKELSIFVDSKNVSFCLDRGVFNARTLVLDYPPYKKIFPCNKPSKISLPRKELMETCNRNKTFNKGESIIMSVNNSIASFSSKSSAGEIEEEILLCDGSEVLGDFKISYNSELLLKILKKFEEDIVTLNVHGVLSPTIISEGSLTSAIMPLKINN